LSSLLYIFDILTSSSAYNMKRRETKAGVAYSAAKVNCRRDILEGGNAVSDDSSNSNSDFDEGTPSPPADAGVMYSFDASRGPSHGSQILNSALAKAVEKFEDKETVRLVRNEYEIVDGDGETPVKKGKAKAEFVADEEEYEFV
jgi:hypothetical protein